MCLSVPQYIDVITSIYLDSLQQSHTFYIITAKFYFTVQYHIPRRVLFISNLHIFSFDLFEGYFQYQQTDHDAEN